MVEKYQVTANIRGEPSLVYVDQDHKVCIGPPPALTLTLRTKSPVLQEFSRAEAAILADHIRKNYNVASVDVTRLP